MNHVYKVPIIPQETEKQQTIVQLAEILYHLSAVTDDVFKNINNRITTNGERLSAIGERIQNVDRKIQKLNGIKKATQIFSTSKYPAVDGNRPYIPIFKDVVPPKMTGHKIKSNNYGSTDECTDKLQIYHVKVKNNMNKSQVSGLGDIPHDLECVNDLLLYNSGKNLYKNFVMSDAMTEVPAQRPQEQMDSGTRIGAAPHSISERSTGTKASNQTFSYAPYLGTVPVLDVPLDLPDLPNIADDLRYDSESGPGIAPSVTITDHLPELPVIETLQETNIIPIEQVPPPSPPLPANLPEVEDIQTAEVPSPPLKEQVPEVKQQQLPQLDMRASLMEAIRNAGGTKKLKSSNEKPTEVKPEPSAGSLMADLHAKLSMRRKGISGNKPEDAAVDAGSTLGKISAMIPPPAETFKSTAPEDDDAEWDD